MDFIYGEDREQATLLPDSIEDYVGSNNSVRVIDAYINSLNVIGMGFKNAELKETGRPPYDPKDLLKLYVYGYLNKIRSSRRLENETKRNLEVLWLLRRLSPDHKTIARFRRDNTEALKEVFGSFVKLSVRLGLYGKELIAIDGSKFKAVNSKARNLTDNKVKNRIECLETHIREYLSELQRIDEEEDTVEGERTAEEIAAIVKELKGKKERYQGYADEFARTGETQKSFTDTESRLMLANGKMDVCYNVQTTVDAKNKLIVDFKVTNQGNDLNFITPMAVSSKENLEVDKITAVTDAGYDSIHDIRLAMSQGIDVHVAGTNYDICIPETSVEQVKISTHKNGRCVYIAERNIVLCPMGQVLYPGYYNKGKEKRGVFYNRQACRECECKCVKNPDGRCQYYVSMKEEDFSKEYNDEGFMVKQQRIKADKAIVQQRKSIVEHPFGTVKRAMDAGYCLTKGIKNVTGEFSLAFLAYNIKRAINILGCRKLIESMS